MCCVSIYATGLTKNLKEHNIQIGERYDPNININPKKTYKLGTKNDPNSRTCLGNIKASSGAKTKIDPMTPI